MHATDPTERLIQRLGYAGLIPFVLLALLLWIVDPALVPFVALALAAYGAAIVSFLGGIHWGVGLRLATEHARVRHLHLVWGIIPPLLAWLALLLPPFAGLPLLAFILVGCYLVDR